MIPVAPPPSGARLPVDAVDASVDAAADPWAVLALAPGAGAGRDHPFLVGAGAAWAAAGVTTVRFDFPYRQAGRRMPGPAAHAVATWTAVEAFCRDLAPGLPFVAAGKSYGGRMASMAAAEDVLAADALVYLGYPLHPPGRPDKSRIEHLPAVTAPQVFVAGTRDPFLQPLDQFTGAVAACRDAEILWVPGGGHSFEVASAKKDAADGGAEVAASVLPWLTARLQRPAA